MHWHSMCIRLCILVYWFSGLLSLSRLLELTLSFPLNIFHLNLIEAHFGPTCYRTNVTVSVSNIPPELDRDAFWFHILVPPATGPMSRWVSAIFHLNLIETHFGPTCYRTNAMVSVSNIPPELDRDAFWSHLLQDQRHGECQQYSTWTWCCGQDPFQFLLLVVLLALKCFIHHHDREKVKCFFWSRFDLSLPSVQ